MFICGSHLKIASVGFASHFPEHIGKCVVDPEAAAELQKGGNSEVGRPGSPHSPFDRLRTNGAMGGVSCSLPTPFGDFLPNTPLKT